MALFDFLKKKKVYEKCPTCLQVLVEKKPKKRVPISVFNSDEVALELDRKKKLQEEAEENELPGPV